MCEVVSCGGERVWISLKYHSFRSDNNQLIHPSLIPILLIIMYDPKSLSKRADQERLDPIPKISKNKRVRQRSPLRAEDILLVKHVEPKTAGASVFSVKDEPDPLTFLRGTKTSWALSYPLICRSMPAS